MAISTISTSTAGRITLGGTSDTVAAPANDMTKALSAAGTISPQSSVTLRINDRAAKAVPHTDASLLLPSNAAGCAVGSTLNKAGIWISPPPPTAASISPAAKANTESTAISIMMQAQRQRRRLQG